MMTSLSTANVHFQCSFELRASEQLIEPWTSLIKMIRKWVEQAPKNSPPTTNTEFFAKWFFAGGEWRASSKNSHIKTRRLIGSGSEIEPEHWALRYEHPCTAPGRCWRSDIAISKLGIRRFQLSIAIMHSIRTGFIGTEPVAPVPTSPRLVSWLLESKDWSAFAGSEQLRLNLQPLKIGHGPTFKQRLEDSNRSCPIILIAHDSISDIALIDGQKLARQLAGAASVYESESKDLDQELKWCLHRDFGCWNGMVRVYQPGLRFGNTTAKQQRYFSGIEIKEQGNDAIIEMLIRGVARRAPAPLRATASSIEDVIAFEREARITQLRGELGTDQTRQEWIKLLEQTNSDLENSSASLKAQVSSLESAIADSEDNCKRLEYERDHAYRNVVAIEKSVELIKARADFAITLDSLPETLEGVVARIMQIHPGRIGLTERAEKSLEENTFSDIFSAWKCLWHIATTLHSLFFSNERPSNIEQSFSNSSGFRLAMTEGGTTKEDTKLMKGRKDKYINEEIDVTPHIKLDKDTTRAYFCPLITKKLIVISYFGHLDTAGTRRRRS